MTLKISGLSGNAKFSGSGGRMSMVNVGGGGGGGGGGGFSATSISNCIVWLKADTGTYQDLSDGATINPAAANNDAVGRWIDQSGQGNHAEAKLYGSWSSSYAPPLHVEGGVSSIDFTQIGDRLMINSFNGRTAHSDPITIFVVYSILAATGDNQIALHQGDYWNIGRTSGGVSYVTMPAGYGQSSATSGPAYPINAGSKIIHEVVIDGSQNMQEYVNGSPYQYRSPSAFDVSNVPVGSNYPICLNGTPGNSSRLNGYMYEVIIYSKALDGTERGQVEAYLNTKYGI